MVGFVALGVAACAIGFAASAAPSGIESNEQALDAVGNAHEALTSEVGASRMRSPCAPTPTSPCLHAGRRP